MQSLDNFRDVPFKRTGEIETSYNWMSSTYITLLKKKKKKKRLLYLFVFPPDTQYFSRDGNIKLLENYTIHTIWIALYILFLCLSSHCLIFLFI